MLTATGNIPPRYRLPFLAVGFVALATGVLGGLARFGWPMPEFAARASGQHGTLMLCGFFGVVIGLERAVAIARAWAYAAPLLAGIGSVALLAGSFAAAAGFTLAGSTVLVLASVVIQRRQPALFTAILTAAALCWLVGNVIATMGSPIYAAVPYWLSFLVLTIAAERLELARFRPPSSHARWIFIACVGALGLGLAGSSERIGRAAIGLAFVALAVWLLHQDIARRTIRTRDLTRYIAACLLAGYVWLAVGGFLIAAFDGLAPDSPARDAALHAIGLGFVFSMVFGHAPIIVPAVLRVTLPYRSGFYVPLALLHASLLLRVAGDATTFTVARLGTIGNAVALAAFIAAMIAAVIVGRREPVR